MQIIIIFLLSVRRTQAQTLTYTESLWNSVNVSYMIGDSGYDDYKLYDLSINRRGFELVCPVSEIYHNTSSDRLQLMNFYESKLGQAIYSWRSISVEPLLEHIKDVFKIDLYQ